ncbi:MAG: trypsin-like peptidase domain-containing protein [Candidatus Saccharibacteria bacterium]|nr:trypsin-like peptidase domain-containing protein [Candidatus Saccharibacteria bacterium]
MDEENNKKEIKEAKKPSVNINTFSVLTFIVALAGLGFGIYNYYDKNIGITTYSGSDGNAASFVEGSIAEVAAKVSDSVVSITTEVRTQSWNGSSSTSTAAGTGFILTEDGYIMTNKHVVEDAKTVNVTLNDGTTYKNVKVVGLDPLNDSAILKVDNPQNFKPVTLGDSKTVNAGQQVIVIGNALGEYQNSVTAGIISGTGRSLVASDSTGSAYERLSDMLQTDAAINGGNSGGPIINAAGEVIGIATAYASSSQTVGFAIPIASVKGIIRNVIATGEFARAVLNISYLPIDASVAEEYNLSVKAGAYLEDANSVVAGGAGEKAGLKQGDIITKVNNVEIGKAGSLTTLIGEYKVGDTVALTVLRDGNETTLKATLQAYKN